MCQYQVLAAPPATTQIKNVSNMSVQKLSRHEMLSDLKAVCQMLDYLLHSWELKHMI